MARANPQGQQVAKAEEAALRSSLLNRPPDDWQKQFGQLNALVGGAAGIAPMATLSATVPAAYMTANSVGGR